MKSQNKKNFKIINSLPFVVVIFLFFFAWDNNAEAGGPVFDPPPPGTAINYFTSSAVPPTLSGSNSFDLSWSIEAAGVFDNTACYINRTTAVGTTTVVSPISSLVGAITLTNENPTTINGGPTISYLLACTGGPNIDTGNMWMLSSTVVVDFVNFIATADITFTTEANCSGTQITTAATGSSFWVNWGTTSMTNCRAAANPPAAEWSGVIPASGSILITNAQATTEYAVVCDGMTVGITPSIKDQTASCTMAVSSSVPPAPTLSFYADPVEITQGETTTLTWQTSNAANCVAGGGWSGWPINTGGSQVMNPAVTTTYTMECFNSVGYTSEPRSVTVTVKPPPPPPCTYSGLTCLPGTPSIDCSVETNCGKSGSTPSFCFAMSSCTGGFVPIPNNVCVANGLICSNSVTNCPLCSSRADSWKEVAP